MAVKPDLPDICLEWMCRGFELTLTEEGRKKHKAVLAVSTWRQERLMTCLPDGASDLFIECLDRLQARPIRCWRKRKR